MPFYRRHPLAMVFLRLAASIAGGAWYLATPTEGFDSNHNMLLAVFIGFVFAWIASFIAVWFCEGWRTARDTPFLEV